MSQTLALVIQESSLTMGPTIHQVVSDTDSNLGDSNLDKTVKPITSLFWYFLQDQFTHHSGSTHSHLTGCRAQAQLGPTTAALKDKVFTTTPLLPTQCTEAPGAFIF